VVEATPEGGVQVRVPQVSLTDEAIEQAGELYDEMFFIEQAELVEAGASEADACGVQIQLSTGAYTNVMMAPEQMNRLLSVFSPKEVQDLFAKVADAVENPQANSCTVCHIMGEKFAEHLQQESV
jgi:DNA-binding MarR family transcriptional regulator